jgi:predicted nuclease with TOPRIM domain
MTMEETERRPAGLWLRVIDPRTGEPVPNAEEEHGDLQIVRGRLGETQVRLGETQVRLGETEGRLAETKGQLSETREEVTALREELTATREQFSRESRVAEDRVTRLEATLQELRAALERRQDPGTPLI